MKESFQAHRSSLDVSQRTWPLLLTSFIITLLWWLNLVIRFSYFPLNVHNFLSMMSYLLRLPTVSNVYKQGAQTFRQVHACCVLTDRSLKVHANEGTLQSRISTGGAGVLEKKPINDSLWMMAVAVSLCFILAAHLMGYAVDIWTLQKWLRKLPMSNVPLDGHCSFNDNHQVFCHQDFQNKTCKFYQ